MRQCNIYWFVNERQIVERAYITKTPDIQAEYSEFHRILCEKYNKCFPYRQLNKPYYTNKPWFINSLKESIKTKDKLFVVGNKVKNSEKRTACYKAYRNRLYHLVRTAERQYYQDLIMQNKDSIQYIGKD